MKTIYQVALLQSLAQGYFDGVISIGELKSHGDTGIGTFDRLNGELIMLNGTAYKALADGSIVIAPDDETVPFSNVTFFKEDCNLPLSGISDMTALREKLNAFVNENSSNFFYMVKIAGKFASIKVRSEHEQKRPYRQLDVALAADQVEYDYSNITGTLVGLYCPNYMGGLNSTGWHFHFISEDLTRGGHVLTVSIEEASASVDAVPGFTLEVPTTTEFQVMDLSRNMDEEIHRAETATSVPRMNNKRSIKEEDPNECNIFNDR